MPNYYELAGQAPPPFGLAVQLESGAVWLGSWSDVRVMELIRFDSIEQAQTACVNRFNIPLMPAQVDDWIIQTFAGCMELNPKAFQYYQDERQQLRFALGLTTPAEPSPRTTVNYVGGVNHGVVARDVHGGVYINTTWDGSR